MDFDFEFSPEIAGLIGQVLLEHSFTLFYHLIIGFVIGVIIAFILFRVIRKKMWFKRNYESAFTKIPIIASHFLFYVSIVGLSCTASLHIGSFKVVEKEVYRVVDYGLEYCNENFFQDEDLMQEVFDVAETLYASGGEVSKMNEAIAQGMVVAVNEKYGLGFIGDWLFGNSKNEMVVQLEAIEKAIIYITVSKTLEYVGQDDLIEADQLDELFNKWIHSDYEKTSMEVREVIGKEIMHQVSPFVSSIWLPFYLMNGLVLVFVIIETVVYFRKQKSIKPL